MTKKHVLVVSTGVLSALALGFIWLNRSADSDVAKQGSAAHSQNSPEKTAGPETSATVFSESASYERLRRTDAPRPTVTALEKESGHDSLADMVSHESPADSGAEHADASRGKTDSKAPAENSKPKLTKLEMDEVIKSFIDETDPQKQKEILRTLIDNITHENAAELSTYAALLPSISGEYRDFHMRWGEVSGAAAVLNGDSKFAMRGWAKEDPASALTWFDSIGEPTDENPIDYSRLLAEDLIRGVSEHDHLMGIELLKEMHGSEQYNSGMTLWVARAAMKEMSFEEVTAWAETLPLDLRQTAIPTIMGDYAHHKAPELIEWSERLKQKGESITIDPSSIAHSWGESDPNAALEWLGSLDEGASGTMEGYASVFRSWGRVDPVKADAYLATMPESPELDMAKRGFASSIVQDDHDFAFLIIDSITDPDLAQASVAEAFGNWTEFDVVATGEYIRDMPESDSRDKALSQYAINLARDYSGNDPSFAMGWAMDIKEPKLREQTVKESAMALYNSNIEGAEAITAWLPGSGLSLDVQNTILGKAN